MEIAAKDLGGLSAGVLQDILREAVNVTHPRRLLLYGSRARGDFDARSDIDLAVEEGEATSLLRLRLEESVGTLLTFDVVDLGNVSDSVREEILREGIVLYEQA